MKIRGVTPPNKQRYWLHPKMRISIPVLSFFTIQQLLLPALVASDSLAQAEVPQNILDEREEDSAEAPAAKIPQTSLDKIEQDSSAAAEKLPQNILDEIEDSFFDSLSRDPSCDDEDCWAPPKSTMETEEQTAQEESCTLLDSSTDQQHTDPDSDLVCTSTEPVDKHWGSDPNIIRMRDKLREAGSVSKEKSTTTTAVKNKRPPVFLMPGLASTRLVAWKFKSCPQHPLLSDIRVQDNVWLNLNLVFQMGTIEASCLKDCLSLGLNQTDTDDLETGCKLRPDEGLDAISSLSPGGIGSQLLVGGTNTVYAWLIQWLADNLGYDVTNIIGLPYDWRLSPERMESRDGFLTLTRRRIEAAVKSNGEPGIMVAHSMGNVVFRYFLEWLRQEMREESYQQYLKRAERKAKRELNLQQQQQQQQSAQSDLQPDASSYLPGWMNGVVSGFDDWWSSYFSSQSDGAKSPDVDETSHSHSRHPHLWELAKIEGDSNWIEWLEQHIWTYVGLSAPMLGAINPLVS